MIVFISNAAHEAVKAYADPNKEWTSGIQLPSGDWAIELSRETIERLRAHAWPNESINDIILRICRRPN